MGVNQKGAKIEKNKEILMRLQAPAHIEKSHFSRHEKVEGLITDKTQNSFLGCDRLLKYDTIFGTVQFAYDSRKSLTFLFANIKPSILDTVASAHQKELDDNKMKNALKTDSENLAFSSKRLKNSASMFYKKDTKPWRESTLSPYLKRANLESLAKSMPFLQRGTQQKERMDLVKEDLELKAMYRTTSDSKQREGIRAQQHTNLRSMETLNSIIIRKAGMTNMFFNKVNSVFDMQKKEMFNYYNKVREETQSLENMTAEQPYDEEE